MASAVRLALVTHEKMPFAQQDLQFGPANGAFQNVGVVHPH